MKLILLFAISIFVESWCLAGQLNFSGRYGVGTLNKNPESGKFAKTSNGTSSYEFELSYYFGNTDGLLFGIVSGNKQDEYIQERSSTRIWDKFISQYRYNGVRLGIWSTGEKESILSGVVTYGKGNFDFEATDHVSGVQNQKPTLLEFDINFQNPFYQYQNFTFDWTGAFRVSKLFLSGFDYKNVDFGADEISRLQFYALIGLAVRY